MTCNDFIQLSNILGSLSSLSVAGMTYGRTVEEILLGVMDINVRPDEILELQKNFNLAVDLGDFDKAQKQLNKMRDILGDDAAEVIENQITLDVEG